MGWVLTHDFFFVCEQPHSWRQKTSLTASTSARLVGNGNGSIAVLDKFGLKLVSDVAVVCRLV